MHLPDCAWLQVEFFKLVHTGDDSASLKIALSHLGPLATKYPALLKPLKETLFTLLRSSEEPSGTHLPLDALATSLQVLCASLCILFYPPFFVWLHPFYCTASDDTFLCLFSWAMQLVTNRLIFLITLW